MTILIIDDDESIRKVLKLRLERAGYRVVVARAGEEGLALAAAERPAVILLDLEMPRMDGREVLRRLKADPGTNPIPVILLTVVGKQDEASLPPEAEFAFHVGKPYHPQELLQKIQSVLAGGPERASG